MRNVKMGNIVDAIFESRNNVNEGTKTDKREVKKIKVNGEEYVLIKNNAMKWFTLTPASNYKRNKIVNPKEKHWEFSFKDFKTEKDCIKYINDKIGKVEESMLGTEIGTGLDKENCEGTDSSMVDTPNGNIGNDKDGYPVECIKCKSHNVSVNIDGEFNCLDCGAVWNSVDPKDNTSNDTKDKIEEGCKYCKGKRYVTDDNMYFTIKNIKGNKVTVYDEDVDKTYDVEVKDLDTLNPTEIKK